ncbi:MAG: flagellin lysine-N-methylase [Clostridia bacterium]|nr:flagellin lysine-N-methylase [Clostridia bacterium]
MKVFPSYYSKFKCIADKCRHSCCIGWEIGVDDDTLAYYRSLDGKIGKKICECIKIEDNGAEFILSDNERCPFLLENGLCELILTLGEDSLCNICTEHPRFRNFIGQREEIGIGMVCEEAARIIVENTESVTLEESEDGCADDLAEFEKQLLSMRSKAFAVILDRSHTLKKRIEMLISTFELYLSDRSIKEWANELSYLERLDKSWDLFLDKLGDIGDEEYLPDGFDAPLEQILHYFIYRHFISAEDENDAKERLAFAVLSVRIIGAIFRKCIEENNSSLETLIEISRMYSGEIEYSEENTESLLEYLSEYRYEIN